MVFVFLFTHFLIDVAFFFFLFSSFSFIVLGWKINCVQILNIVQISFVAGGIFFFNEAI